MPAVPSCLLEPIWVEFRALLGAERPPFDPGHPLGCNRRRVPDRVVFEHVVAALVHGSGYERIATAGCSDRTIRRRLKDWAERGIGQQVHALALAAYDQSQDGTAYRRLAGADSPTRPNVSPLSIERLTPSTALRTLAVPQPRRNSTERSRTSTLDISTRRSGASHWTSSRFSFGSSLSMASVKELSGDPRRSRS